MHKAKHQVNTFFTGTNVVKWCQITYRTIYLSMRLFKHFTEVLGWLCIAASPALAGALAGFLVYLAIPEVAGMVLGLLIMLAGILTGGTWATRIWRKRGTMSFLANEKKLPKKYIETT